MAAAISGGSSHFLPPKPPLSDPPFALPAAIHLRHLALFLFCLSDQGLDNVRARRPGRRPQEVTAAAADGGSHAAPPVRLQRDMGDHPGDHPGQTRLWAVPSVQMACRRHAFTHQLSAGPQNGPNGRCKCGPAEGRACAYPVFLEIRCQVLGARSANLASSGTLRPHDGRGQGPRGLPPWIFFKGATE